MLLCFVVIIIIIIVSNTLQQKIIYYYLYSLLYLLLFSLIIFIIMVGFIGHGGYNNPWTMEVLCCLECLNRKPKNIGSFVLGVRTRTLLVTICNLRKTMLARGKRVNERTASCAFGRLFVLGCLVILSVGVASASENEIMDLDGKSTAIAVQALQ